MKVRILKIFTLIVALSLPLGDVWGDPFDSRVENIPDERGGGLAGHCELEDAGKWGCTANSIKSNSAMGLCKKFSGKPSCAAQECNKGYYLWLDSKGNSQGICHSMAEAQKRCDKNKNLCPDGEVFSPNIIDNPKLTPELKKLGGQQQAWQGCSCQPNCTGVYGGNAEAVACCKYNEATWNKSNNRCDCTQPGYEWKYDSKLSIGSCVEKVSEPTKPEPVVKVCPDGTTKKYENGQCVPRCNEGVASWRDGKCVCNDIGKTYNENTSDINKSTCDCMAPTTEYDAVNQKCIKPTKCPDGDGTPPNCQCKAPKTNYVLKTNSCECPDDKPTFKDGQCIKPTRCPSGADGTPPDCRCKAPKTKYVPGTNSCECPDDGPVFKNGQCIAQKICPFDATGTPPNCKCTDKNKQYDSDENECVNNRLNDLRQAWQDARDNELSDANKLLTAGTTLATGLGGMELARGWAEQSADKKADESMDAYIVTMRCTYGDGKPVTVGNELIELPGGNDETMKKYRKEYISLAADLKERKESLSMKLGIESEVVLDKAKMGLYDDENVGITGGSYASLYRAKMMDSETDKAKIASDQEASSNRMKYGGLALGVGAAVGILGNSLINGRLGEKIKEIKENINYRRNEESALKDLKQCLKDAGATNVNKLKFDKFTPSVLNLDGIDCKKDLVNIKGKDATTLFADSDDGETITNKLVKSFGKENTSAMLGDVVVPGQSFEIKAEQIVETPKGNKAIITRFESDTDYGDGVGYCYNFIDGFVRGEIQSKDCDALKEGDWIAQFSGGTIEGISVCSTVRPDGMEHGAVPPTSQQKQIQQSYDDWVKAGRPQPRHDAKTACYCKKNGQDTNWVFDSYFTGFSCRSGCAYFCAYLTKEQTSFRKAVAGK